MALLKLFEALSQLGRELLKKDPPADPGGSAASSERAERPTLLRPGMLPLCGGLALGVVAGLWLSHGLGTVKVGFDLQDGFVLQLDKRDLVRVVEALRFPDAEAGEVRQLRSEGKGPWHYPALALAARSVGGITRGEAAVCRDSELLGERIVLSNERDGLQAIKVSASLFPMGCDRDASGRDVIFLGAEDMQALGGGAAGSIGIKASVLSRDLPRQIEILPRSLAQGPHAD